MSVCLFVHKVGTTQMQSSLGSKKVNNSALYILYISLLFDFGCLRLACDPFAAGIRDSRPDKPHSVSFASVPQIASVSTSGITYSKSKLCKPRTLCAPDNIVVFTINSGLPVIVLARLRLACWVRPY